MKILLFLIYGSGRDYHLELTYSILSAAHFLKDNTEGVRIVLAADAANQRPDLPVEHLVIEEETLSKWQLGGSYFHAAKPRVLARAIQHFRAPTILMDSDTILRAHPKHLFDRTGPGKSLMHLNHGRLDRLPNRTEWDALIHESKGSIAGWRIGNDTHIYNSGLLGLNPQDSHLLDDIIATMHAIRNYSEVFTAEQLAASIVLNAKTQINTCEDIVEHYWDGPRTYYHYQMSHMFPQVLNGGGIDEKNTILAPLDREPSIRLMDKIAAHIKGFQRGRDSSYIYAYMAYRSALSCGHNDPDLANVWADRSLSMLTWGLSRQHTKTIQDFSAFQPQRLQTLHWMRPSLRSRWADYWKRLSDKRSVNGTNA